MPVKYTIENENGGFEDDLVSWINDTGKAARMKSENDI